MHDLQAPIQPTFVWNCPECGRRVPNRLNDCRCGYQRDGEAALAPVAPSALSAPPPPSAKLLPWVVLTGVALAAAGTLIALQVAPIKQNRAPASAAADAGAATAGLAEAGRAESDDQRRRPGTSDPPSV